MIEYENLARSNAQWMDELEKAIVRVLRSGRYVLGDEVAQFEMEFAAAHGMKHCIGVGNGLDALILSIECMNLPPRSDILLASNTYIATIIAVIRAGHNPILVEPDEASMNIDPLALDLALTQNTRGICVTHMYGKPCRMDAICDFAKAHDLRLIEDCAQSHGARFKDKWTGTFGDAGCFSFYPTKNLGGLGDGGAVITNDDALAERLKHVRNYGSSRKYVNRYVGVNSRLDELQAAALRVKLRHLDTITTHKRQLADLYFRRLNSVVQLPACHQDEFDVFHIFAIRHPDRDRLRTSLVEAGVHTEIHYPIAPHRQDALKDIIKNTYPVSERIHQTILSLPISVGHTEADIEKVIDTMLAVI